MYVTHNCVHVRGFKLFNITDESMQAMYVKFVQEALLQFRIIHNVAILLIQLL